MISIKHETNIETLRQVALLLEAEVKRLMERIKALTAELRRATGTEEDRLQLELDFVKEQLDRRIEELYGRSSERRSGNGEGKGTGGGGTKERVGHGPTEQLELPIVEKVHELDPADKVCPKCGGLLRELDGQEEESEEVDIVHREYRIVRHKRKKYVCRCGGCVETALGPTKLIPGGRYSVDFGVDVAVSKYADHLPLARQVKQMARYGLEVSAQTLWDQLWALAEHLRPTYEAIHKYVLKAPVVGADETTWRMMKKGESKNWWVWSVTRADAVYYRILANRNARAAEEVLKGYRGVVVADGYSAYGVLAKECSELSRAGPGFVLANCWAHARRKFVESEGHYTVGGEAIEIIGRLYEVERRAKERTEGKEETERLAVILRMRQEESAPVVKEFYEWVLKQRVLPRSGLGMACAYALKYKSGLMKFLEDARIPIDNNQTEREMRPVAVGRKNHYGSKSIRGTKVAALFYTLIESARMNGLNPVEYLSVATRRAIENPGAVTLPSDLAKERSAA